MTWKNSSTTNRKNNKEHIRNIIIIIIKKYIYIYTRKYCSTHRPQTQPTLQVLVSKVVLLWEVVLHTIVLLVGLVVLRQTLGVLRGSSRVRGLLLVHGELNVGWMHWVGYSYTLL